MYNVIFIDDEPWSAIDAQQSIKWEDYGFTVTKYLSDPKVAIDVICSEQPALCITDICMPNINGLELIRHCLNEGVSTKFILLSGYTEFEYAREAVKLGVLDYWLKPINPNEVHKKLESVSRVLSNTTTDLLIDDLSDDFNDILSYLHENYHQKILLQELADTFGFNKNYLCSLFSNRLGVTFVQYLNEIRIQKACELLASSDLPVAEIGELCGIPDPAYFNKVFKKFTGNTPSKYKEHRK